MLIVFWSLKVDIMLLLLILFLQKMSTLFYTLCNLGLFLLLTDVFTGLGTI